MAQHSRPALSQWQTIGMFVAAFVCILPLVLPVGDVGGGADGYLVAQAIAMVFTGSVPSTTQPPRWS